MKTKLQTKEVKTTVLKEKKRCLLNTKSMIPS